VKIAAAGGDTLVTLWVDQAHEVFDLVLASEPVAITVDPDNWILNKAQEVSYAGIRGDGRGDEAALTFRLERGVPNPFTHATTIAYCVPRAEHVRLDIYCTTGRRVACLLDGPVGAGRGEVIWDGTDGEGRRVAPGAYFCRLAADSGTRMARIVLVR
jgi:hypothetical protein